MISTLAISQDTIKTELQNYLESLDEYQAIKDNIPSATLDILLDLISAYGTYDIYKYRAWRSETYIDEAKLDNSIYNLASMLGYRINRPTPFKLSIQYNGRETIVLSPGDIIGSYKNYDLVYLDEQKKYEMGDEFTVSIGYKKEYDINTNLDSLVFVLDPETGTYITNFDMWINLEGTFKKLSLNLEDYVIYSEAVDYSKTVFSSKVFIYDKINKYGLYEEVEDIQLAKLVYLEQDLLGDIKLEDVNLDENFLLIGITHRETPGDSTEFIRFIAPLYFSTVRRMVTNTDHEYIIKSHPYIKDCKVEKDSGIPLTIDFTIDSFNPGDYFYIQVKDNKIDYYATEDDTVESILKYFYIAFTDNNTVNAYYYENLLRLEQKNISDAEFDITYSDNFNATIIKEYKPSECCTIDVYYIKFDTNDENYKILTQQEMEELSNFILKYKMVGIKIIFFPAISEVYNLDMTVYVKKEYKDYFIEKMDEILSEYELVLDKDFSYPELLTKLNNIIYIDTQTLDSFHIVNSIIPNQELFNLEGKKDRYYYFNKNINVIEME